MRFLGSLGLLSLACLLWTSGIEAETFKDDAINLTVRLDVTAGQGSGLVLRKVQHTLFVLTALHVVEESEGVEATLPLWPDRRLRAERLSQYESTKFDLALLRIEIPPELRAALPLLEPKNVHLGSLNEQLLVRAVGNPFHKEWMVSPAVEIQELQDRSFLFNFECRPGFSGGGVFDTSWRLVGMAQRRWGSLLCEAAPIGQIQQVLREWGIEPQWRVMRASDSSARVEREIYLAKLTSRTSAVASSNLDPAALTAAIRTASGFQISRSNHAEEGWSLTVSLTEYDQITTSTNSYGVTIQTDSFRATFLVEITDSNGLSRMHRNFTIEVNDFRGAKGWKQRRTPPVGPLLEALAHRMAPDLTSALESSR